MRTSEGPTVDRLEFAQLCRGIDEFELLPDHTRSGLVDEKAAWFADERIGSVDDPAAPDVEEPTALDEVILAGLVSPV